MSLIGAAIDTETTGLLDPEHRLVEIYIDLFDWDSRKVLFSYEQRINPERSITVEAQRIHGISFSDVAHSPTWREVGPKVSKILSKAQLFVAHNAAFDFAFLNQELPRIGLPALTMPVLCTMESSIWANPVGKKPSLKELCFTMGVDYDESLAHAASYDVRKMTECLFRGIDWGLYQKPEVAGVSARAA